MTEDRARGEMSGRPRVWGISRLLLLLPLLLVIYPSLLFPTLRRRPMPGSSGEAVAAVVSICMAAQNNTVASPCLLPLECLQHLRQRKLQRKSISVGDPNERDHAAPRPP